MCPCSLEDILQQKEKEFKKSGTGYTFVTPAKIQTWSSLKMAFSQIFSGMVCLHSNGVLHRDIKPDNIVKAYGNVFKLCDFGVAKVIKKGGKNTSNRGSSWYSAPEKRRGNNYDFPSDVYSAGVTFLEGLFHLCNKSDVCNALKDPESAFSHELTVGLVHSEPMFRLVYAMMSRKGSDRPTMEHVLNALQSHDFTQFPEVP